MSDLVRVALDIHTVVEVVDDGYLGYQASVQEHIDKAIKDAQGWQFSVKQGAATPRVVHAAVTVRSVSIVPEKPDTHKT